MSLYPRTTTLNGKEKLVTDDALVTVREHLLQKHRIVLLSGGIGIGMGGGSFELDSVGMFIAAQSMSDEPIKLFINSPGGSVDAMFTIYDMIRMSRVPIYTLGAECASAAAVLMAAGHKRYMLPHGKMMLHLPSAGFSGDAREWEIQQKEMDKCKNSIVDALVECGVKKEPEAVLRDIDREYWMDAKETIAYGLSDEVMTPEIMKEWLTT